MIDFTATLQHLIATDGRHPVTIGRDRDPNPLSLAYHPDANMITAGRPHDYPTPAQNLAIAAALTRLLNLQAIAVGNRIGRSDHALTKGVSRKGQEYQYHESNLFITEFMWNKKETP